MSYIELLIFEEKFQYENQKIIFIFVLKKSLKDKEIIKREFFFKNVINMRENRCCMNKIRIEQYDF